MLLELSNFLCYEGVHRVHFKPGAFTLLTGESGAGKTTLMNAVEWCLFGTRRLLTAAIRVDESHGEEEEEEVTDRKGANMWVRLSWDASERVDGKNLIVHRVKGNNKIYVSHGDLKLSGVTAQNIIVRLFGSLNLWRSSSYIAQRERCALLTMPSKKELLTELDRLAYQGGGGFGVCEDDLQCLTPGAARARIDEFLRDREKRLNAANDALHFEEGKLDQFLQSNPAVAEAVHAGLASEYSESDHAQARERVETVRREIALADTITKEIDALRADIRAMPDTTHLESALNESEALCAAAKNLAARVAELDTLRGRIEEGRAWLAKNGGGRPAPNPPTIAPEVIEQFGHPGDDPYPDTLPKPPFPQLFDVAEDELRYAERYEAGAAWMEERFDGVEYTREGVRDVRAFVMREIARRELIAELDLYIDSEDDTKEEIERLRSEIDAAEERETGRRAARQRVEAQVKKFGAAWCDRALTFDDEALVALARSLAPTHTPRPGAEPADPSMTKNQAVRSRFKSTMDSFKRLQCVTIDDLEEERRRFESLVAASEVQARRHEAERRMMKVSYATLEHTAELRRRADAMLATIETERAKLEYSDAMPCPSCRAALVHARGSLILSDGVSRDDRNRQISETVARMSAELAELRTHIERAERDSVERSALELTLRAELAALDRFGSDVIAEILRDDAWEKPQMIEHWKQSASKARLGCERGEEFRLFFGLKLDERPTEEDFLRRRDVLSLPPRQFNWLCSVADIRAARAELDEVEARCAGHADPAKLRARLVELTNTLDKYRAVLAKIDELGECEMADIYPIGETGLAGLRSLARELAALWIPDRGAPARPSHYLRECMEKDRAAREEYESEILRIHNIEVAAKKANLDLAHYRSASLAHEERCRRAEAVEGLEERAAALAAELSHEAERLGIRTHPLTTRAVEECAARAESRRAASVSAMENRKHKESVLDALSRRLTDEVSAEVRGDPAKTLDAACRALSHHDALRTWDELRDEYRRLMARIDAQRSQAVSLSVRIENARSLKKYAEALETRMLEQIISDLNTSLEEICPSLFKPGASVYLTLTKQNASNDNLRTSFDIHLVQGGKDIVLSGVSGGEGDRVSFAMTLALADLPAFYGSPVILLDETMGSLNQEMREQCISAIKEFAHRRPHKTIVAVDHLTLSGLFDEVKMVDAARVFRLVNGVAEPEGEQ